MHLASSAKLSSIDQISSFHLSNSQLLIISDQSSPSISPVTLLELDNFPASSSIISHKQIIYFSAGQSVSCLENSTEKIIFLTSEEINEIAINSIGTIIASADDSGTISFHSLKQNKTLRSRTQHTNIAGSISFRPTLPRQAASGGFDCTVKFWDCVKGRETCSILLKGNQNRPQTCNPPHVHCLEWSLDGNKLAVGLGSGDIAIIDVPRIINAANKPEVTYLSAVDGHSWSVAAVKWIIADRIVTGGLDKKVKLWSLGECEETIDIGVKVNCLEVVEGKVFVGGNDAILRVLEL